MALVLTLAAVLANLIPPGQSPDELAHLGRAYVISRGEWLLEQQPRQDSGGRVDPKLGQYFGHVVPLIQDYRARLSADEWLALKQIEWGGEASAYVPLAGTGYYLPVLYAPHALALATGRALGLSVHHSYWLARWTVIACCALLVCAALRLWMPNPLVLVLMLLPMSLFQAVSPTLDGISAALLLLTMALFLRQWHSKSAGLEKEDVALGLCLVVLCSVRIHLLPALALPWLLAFKRRGWPLAGLATAVALLTTAWVIWAMRTVVDTSVARSMGTSETMVHYLSHPAELGGVLMNTLTSAETVTFYARSFVGVLGWLDTPLSAWAYPVLALGMLMAGGVSASANSLKQDWPLRLVLLGMGLACVGMVFLAMLLTWTPYPAQTIQGVQGRYFLLPAMVMAYSLSGVSPRPTWSKMGYAVVALTGTVAFGALVSTLLARYQ